MAKVKGYLACLLFVPFALDTSHKNHCRVCQERWRSFLATKIQKFYFPGLFIELFTLPKRKENPLTTNDCQGIIFMSYACLFTSSASASFGWKPTTWSTTFPSFINNNVGILITPYLPAVSWLSSTFSLAIFTLSPNSPSNSSNTGAIILQGPHQGAQKSTST